MNRCSRLQILVPLVLLLATSASGQDLTGALLDQGMRHYAQQNWAGAADYLGQVCDMAPDQHTARYYLVYSLLMMRKFPEALSHANILVQRNPGQPAYLQLQAQIQQAIAAQAAPRPDGGGGSRPGVPPKEVVLGGYEPASGKGVLIEPKMPTGPRPSKPKPPKADTPLDTAIAHIDAEEYPQAVAILDDLLKKDPKNAKALHYRGVVEFNQRQYGAARDWFKKAVAVDPKGFETWFLMGDAANRESKFGEARDAFAKAVAIKEDVFALLNLADAQRKLGKAKEAEEIYKKIVKIDSNVVEAKVNLADAQLEQGRVDDAAVLINDVLSINPTNGFAHYVKGKILFRSDLNEDAISELKLALSTSPDNDLYRLAMAKALLKGFRTGEATELGGAVLRDNPNSYEARLILAEALLMEGQTGDAEEHVDQAEKIMAGPELNRLRGLIALRNGDQEKAKTMFQTYISQDSTNGFAYLEYADVLEKAGDVPSALEVYKLIKSRFGGTALEAQADAKLTALGGAAAAGEAAPPAGAEAPPATPATPPPAPGKVRY
ncbi:MAG: tetratricopeptide repeat protein [Candidatus Riflebacteria bacterium]|nr:tetratricopeptide repeat protein [Candidatus Riflebacteria bacterium]